MKTGDLMLVGIAATATYALLISVGVLFRFICVDSLWLILLFALLLPLLRLFYPRASCRSLEIKDAALALAVCMLEVLLLHSLFHPVDIHAFCYLYLCTYVGVVQLACSCRFKTLIH